MSNLKLWQSVQTTDPKFTKAFNRGGGFKGTATNATYLAMKATEKFGPCGIGWGMIVDDDQYIAGHHINERDRAIIHRVRVRLWYILNEQRGEIVQYGQTEFVGSNKYGPFTDEEAPKKSLTDAMSKCLSLLGFSADIHLGMYDDHKYVTEISRKLEAEQSPKVTAEQAKHIRDMIAEAGADQDAFLGWLGAASVDAIPAGAYDKSVKALQAKIDKAAQS